MPAVTESDVKLMLAIIGSAEMIKTDNEKLASIIGGTTANAIRQRVAKIKNLAKAVFDGTGTDIALGGTATTKAKSTPKKAAVGAKFASPGEDDAEDSTAPASAPKKRAANGKAKGTPRAKKLKEEAKLDEQDGEDGGREVGEEEGSESPVKRVKSDESPEA
ncbi:hypothetical protein FKW77_002949 [Venturia effusa]|uniref:Uncharacterized protein n=1 Tax=Venturia effusa TaxID=50376 RepID=A0A517L2X5_9PEZI|nr:hypothetical protein FKW77_002949 [Venturia effusa]